MANYINFTEGVNELGDSGLPATVYFELVDGDVDSMAVGNTLASGTQTAGTATKSYSTPAFSGRVVTFLDDPGGLLTWTETSGSPKAVRLLTSARGGGGKAICAWNLNGGAAVNLATAAPLTLESLAFKVAYQAEP